MKKILYPLIGHNCVAEDLQFIQQPVDREVLHTLGLNGHFPRAVLHAPLLYGGLGSHTIHAHHVIEKLLLFVHHIRENGQIKETLMTSMSTTQIECGVSVPFFSLSADIWNPLVTSTWPAHLWQECKKQGIDIKFHTDTFWVPKAPREKYVCIMDIATTMYQGQHYRLIGYCSSRRQENIVSLL